MFVGCITLECHPQMRSSHCFSFRNQNHYSKCMDVTKVIQCVLVTIIEEMYIAKTIDFYKYSPCSLSELSHCGAISIPLIGKIKKWINMD